MCLSSTKFNIESSFPRFSQQLGWERNFQNPVIICSSTHEFIIGTELMGSHLSIFHPTPRIAFFVSWFNSLSLLSLDIAHCTEFPFFQFPCFMTSARPVWPRRCIITRPAAASAENHYNINMNIDLNYINDYNYNHYCSSFFTHDW